MNAQTKDQVLAILHERHPQLKKFGVKRYGLFGSFVRNQQSPASDIDILVEFDPSQKTFDNFMHLAFYLEDLFERKVDLLTTESLSPQCGLSRVAGVA
jgi:predicted nucleotidyltransferase